MNTFLRQLRFLPAMAILLLFANCEEWREPSDLVVNLLSFEETYAYRYVDFEDGTFVNVPDNFSFTNPSTWTGEVAQYVKHFRLYDIQFEIENVGGMNAYDVELDLHFEFDNGEEEIITYDLGDIDRKRLYSEIKTEGWTNRALMNCYAELFWYE